MEAILGILFITFIGLFGLSVPVGLIAMKYGEEEIETWCLIICFSSITLAFTTGLIGVLLYGEAK